MNGYLKAIYGAVSTGLGALITALAAFIAAGKAPTTLQIWLMVATVLATAVLSFGAVYGVTNTPPAPPST